MSDLISCLQIFLRSNATKIILYLVPSIILNFETVSQIVKNTILNQLYSQAVYTTNRCQAGREGSDYLCMQGSAEVNGWIQYSLQFKESIIHWYSFIISTLHSFLTSFLQLDWKMVRYCFPAAIKTAESWTFVQIKSPRSSAFKITLY